ncbi:DUF1289 domain-containing protein [Pseudomonas sp. S75]|uniref:DUF1289 domain-containing protein n=1 Tax=unclassified Pseudomonas TaxID=196821 RepID=UPI00190308E0|nr:MULTISPECIES: DUF1289 domain-containing protein [unclassified Pseudomonas]MBJ9975257.1 DUF1289 domain-containing protein [Pseudomonas sp. S30]MBK0152769.1 DUF1289 domain-containing protein [Pseudomonas sp. S75]
MAKDIENPCVSQCRLNGEMCVSCGRTKEEIRTWRKMKRPEKKATVQKAAERMKSVKKKKKKSKA